MAWPEGAVDYVARRLGGSEMEEDWWRYGRVGWENVTEEYVRKKEADPGWSPPESAFWREVCCGRVVVSVRVCVPVW